MLHNQCGHRRSNGEGTIYFNENKKRWIVQITYVDIMGEKKRKSFSSFSKTEAINKKNLFIEQNAIGMIPAKSKLTIYGLLKNYIENEHDLNYIGDAAYTRKLHTLSIIEKDRISSIPISKIEDNDIINFLKSIVDYSNSVISKVYSLLKKGFNLACEHKIIMFNPMEKSFIRKPNSTKLTKKVRAFTVEEEKAFLIAMKNYAPPKNSNNYKLQLLIALFTGMRMGEINALSINDIDFNSSIIHINKTITRGVNYEIIVGDTAKTPNRVRDIPMSSYVVSLFKEAVNNYRYNNEKLLFYNYNSNRPITTAQVNDAFKRFCTKNKIFSGTNQHMLRHTFATRCIEAGIEAEVLMKWLGHKDITTTINTYTDVFAKMHNKAIDRFTEYSKKNFLLYDSDLLNQANQLQVVELHNNCKLLSLL